MSSCDRIYIKKSEICAKPKYLCFSLIKGDMESRLANLKLNGNVHDEQLKDKQQEIEQECVSWTLTRIFSGVDNLILLFRMTILRNLTIYFLRLTNVER